MPQSVDTQYFHWLTNRVLNPGTNLYIDLLQMLHAREFTWLVEGDQNRAEEGVELRGIFMSETGSRGSPGLDVLGCSVLEMLIGFANRCSFQTVVSEKTWFWIFIRNLGLSEFRHVGPEDEDSVNDIVHAFVSRSYGTHGEGGIFPLRWTDIDQSRAELWHQFFEYLDQDEPT